jgi:hypothetical protein
LALAVLIWEMNSARLVSAGFAPLYTSAFGMVTMQPTILGYNHSIIISYFVGRARQSLPQYTFFKQKEKIIMTSSNGIPISWPLRTWLAVEVLFGIGAVLAIGLSPADTATNFAWPIQPVVMAAVLGAFYITSAPLFLLPFLAKRWEMIRAMIINCDLSSGTNFQLEQSHFTYGSRYCCRRFL